MDTPIALCSYDPTSGWRVMGVSKSETNKVGIFKFGSIKLLKLPLNHPTKAGRFCNPRKLIGV